MRKIVNIVAIAVAICMLITIGTASSDEPVTTCYMTEEDANKPYSGDINVSIKTYNNSADRIEIELLEPVSYGNLQTILLNISTDCILGAVSDNPNIVWMVSEDKGSGNAGFGSMLTAVDKTPGDKNEIARKVMIYIDCADWDGNLTQYQNEEGYAVALHVTQLDASDSSRWLGCDGGGGIEEIPEFPIIALPIAAVLGLAFCFQRRKE